MPLTSALLTSSGSKVWAVILQRGDEALSELKKFAAAQKLDAASIQGIGAFERVVLGYFQGREKGYKRITVNEQVEVLSLLGDITSQDGKPKLHMHVVVGKSDGSAAGGHLLEAHVRPTLELIVTETPAHLRRTPDAESGLALIDLSASAEVAGKKTG